MGGGGYGAYRHFQQYSSYILEVRFIGGVSWVEFLSFYDLNTKARVYNRIILLHTQFTSNPGAIFCAISSFISTFVFYTNVYFLFLLM
jgi:hypothetical protein